MRTLAELTWDDVAASDLARLIVLLPVGATEAHGPHLPLGTDVIIADAMARAGADRLDIAGHDTLLLPPLAYTAAAFAAGFPGTIGIRPETETALIVDIGRALAAHGLTTLVIVNAHLDPAHIGAIYAAVTALTSDGLRVIFPDVTRKPWALRLTAEFKSGACHAGQYEGSIVLAERPDLVRESVRAALPDNPASLSTAIRAGKRSFEEAGGDRAYFGSPAAATADEGRATIATLGQILADAVTDALGAAPDSLALR